MNSRAAPLLLLTLTACSSQPQFVEVTGAILLDGKPMPDALVQFLPDPDSGTRGPRCSGVTDADGRFKLVCDDERVGTVIGVHRVLVQDTRTFPPPRNRHTEGKPPVMPPSRVSNRYENAGVTPLRQQVTAAMPPVTVEVTSK